MVYIHNFKQSHYLGVAIVKLDAGTPQSEEAFSGHVTLEHPQDEERPSKKKSFDSSEVVKGVPQWWCKRFLELHQVVNRGFVTADGQITVSFTVKPRQLESESDYWRVAQELNKVFLFQEKRGFFSFHLEFVVSKLLESLHPGLAVNSS